MANGNINYCNTLAANYVNSMTAYLGNVGTAGELGLYDVANDQSIYLSAGDNELVMTSDIGSLLLNVPSIQTTSLTVTGSGSNLISGITSGTTRFLVGSTGTISGGANYATSSLRMTLNLSDSASFPSCAFTAPGGYYLRVANVGVYGSSDMFFQGVVSGSNWTYLEGWSGAGLAVGTGPSDSPIDIRPGRSTKARFKQAGLHIGGATDPTAQLDLSGDTLRIRTAKTPSSASVTGNAGDHCWDSSYFYICTATNTWRRVAHATW